MQNREENGSGKMVDVGIVFQKMLMLLVMMSIGFLAGKTRVMSVESNHMLSLLINKITMPCLVVYSSVCNAHSMSNRELLILLGIYFVSFALMIVVARLFRLLVWILVSRLNYEDCCSIAETRQMSFFHRFI